MAEMATIEMQDRELFAAMAMQAPITREGLWAADMIAKQAVAYADALIEALAATALKQHQMRARVSDPGASTWANKKPRRCDPTRLFFGDCVSALSGDMSAFSDDSYLPETSCYDEISIHRSGTELRHAKFKRSIQNSATA